MRFPQTSRPASWKATRWKATAVMRQKGHRGSSWLVLHSLHECDLITWLASAMYCFARVMHWDRVWINQLSLWLWKSRALLADKQLCSHASIYRISSALISSALKMTQRRAHHIKQFAQA